MTKLQLHIERMCPVIGHVPSSVEIHGHWHKTSDHHSTLTIGCDILDSVYCQIVVMKNILF